MALYNFKCFNIEGLKSVAMNIVFMNSVKISFKAMTDVVPKLQNVIY